MSTDQPGDQPGHDVAWWDAKHRDRPVHDDVDPSVRAACVPLQPAPGGAVDLACGTGRHARWLAHRGWEVTGVDSSPGGLEVAQRAAQEQAVDQRCRWVVADARGWQPEAPVALVVVALVALPRLVERAAQWLAPGGRVVVVGHALANASRGVGGPRDARLLHDVAALRERARDAGMRVRLAAEVERPVVWDDDERRVQVDAVLVADRRP
ncbi:class I SAM-dependent methyltransferase [Quadrisphaera oryzae]|uniref:class I SAM-dependent methyltransferase n=1 Tax=Quadrisphaera TaxID=317661 RepID=UPI001644CBBB|nr:class I SAM-dependent methyltransferase [Quadrisphaera sp. RL12-1S]MBC3761596.1 class I SAM-dependent methyltransferase [Quadrisphaera sp. RL12-1S]